MKAPFSSYARLLGLNVLKHNIIDDFPVTGVGNDSRAISPGMIFAAIKGASSDGHRFIDQAISAGANAVIVGQPEAFREDINCLLVSDSYQAYALMCEHFYGFPASRMINIAVTGTNGKTTTAFILHHLISAAGHSCGMISTVKYLYGNNPLPAPRTTPEAAELQQLFSGMSAARCSHCVMECSSHGLHQYRLASTIFAAAIFTNLTGDHLDYHGDMENYYQSKKLLFTRHTNRLSATVINTDDPYGQRLADELDAAGHPYVIHLGQGSKCHYRIAEASLSAGGSSFSLITSVSTRRFHSPLPGWHNIHNYAGAIAAADAIGIPVPEYLNDFSVPGRLERHHSAKGFDVYVDYAHTDDALIRVLQALRPLCQKRLITVFGCGGDRDRSKRPRMGAAAESASDLVIVTSDNPRSEDPIAIINDITRGIDKRSGLIIEPDREKAIALAIGQAGHGDIVLIAGKGHEDYQEIAGRKLPFSDSDTVRSLLQ